MQKTIIAVMITVTACASAHGVRAESDESPVRFVDPFIGTGGHGHTYPGVVVPFGMVQLGPDTRLTGWDGCSGYHYSDDVLYGFSHTHLSGTGCSDYGDILFLPTVGTLRRGREGAENEGGGRCSRFRHESEYASPGYYRVVLDDYGIEVELTATKRAGMHRYLFPPTEEANVVIDLEHRDEVLESELAFSGDREVEGFRRSRAWAKDQHIYFVARFSRPFHTCDIEGVSELRYGGRGCTGRDIRGYASFSSDGRTPLIVAVGISAVDIAGARANLEAEIGGRTFEEVRGEAEDEWDRALGRISIEGATPRQRRIFYTALYHTMLAPNLFMDVDGRYRGRDLEVHRAEDFTYYTVFSLWDTFRAAHPLFTIIEPARTVDFIKTFLAQYRHGGRLPVWELAANETNCMIGYHAVSVIVDAFVKGIRGFDIELAYEAMKHSASTDLFGLDHYRRYGHVPADREGESVSKTLEYAYDDWCIAQVARELGRDDDYRRYLQRAQYYKNVFDRSTGFMRAKANATWAFPFDPAEVNFNYTEANAWQYTFSVPQDVGGLIDLIGGEEAFIAKLDGLFGAPSAVTGREQPDITGLIGQYAHGNEPSHHVAYLYAYAGAPWKTQQRVHEIMATMYHDRPDGLCGNEDCGQMSAWFVFSAMGFYPVTPGSDIYVIGSPLFEEATIDVGEGKRFTVLTRNTSAGGPYIRAAVLNGKPYTRSYLRHDDIVSGGEIVFEMGSEPNGAWGSAPVDRPVSAITEHLICPVPSIEPVSRAFVGSTEITLQPPADDARIRYTMDGTEPNGRSPIYTGPIVISESTVIKAYAERSGMERSGTVTASFNEVPEGLSIELLTPYSPMYTAGGDLALIDAVRGGRDFRTGAWQGYHGVDLSAVVDLGEIRRIETIVTTFLQDVNSWIFMPADVEYSVSTDGTAFTVVRVIENDVSDHDWNIIIRDFTGEGIDTEARFVRVRARNIGVCPAWHKGAGNRAWIFADEITIR